MALQSYPEMERVTRETKDKDEILSTSGLNFQGLFHMNLREKLLK